jgi:hypothetical protein
MVTARKARPGRSRRRETPQEKFERVRREPVGTPMKLTKAEARYFLTKLAGSDPRAPRGRDVIKAVRGDWGERLDLLTKR